MCVEYVLVSLAHLPCFLLEDITVSWYEANETCTSYNSSLLSFSSYNDVMTIQALLMEVIGLPDSHIFIGLQGNKKVTGSALLCNSED